MGIGESPVKSSSSIGGNGDSSDIRTPLSQSQPVGRKGKNPVDYPVDNLIGRDHPIMVGATDGDADRGTHQTGETSMVTGKDTSGWSTARTTC